MWNETSCFRAPLKWGLRQSHSPCNYSNYKSGIGVEGYEIRLGRLTRSPGHYQRQQRGVRQAKPILLLDSIYIGARLSCHMYTNLNIGRREGLFVPHLRNSWRLVGSPSSQDDICLIRREKKGKGLPLFLKKVVGRSQGGVRFRIRLSLALFLFRFWSSPTDSRRAKSRAWVAPLYISRAAGCVQ